jgi:putative restriction endonuclease
VLNLNEIENQIVHLGGEERHEVEYAIRYYIPDIKQFVYINKQAGQNYSGLVIHPRFDSNREDLKSISGVDSNAVYIHNSSFRRFPKRYHGGREPIPYGVPFGFDSELPLIEFFKKLGITPPVFERDVESEMETAEADGEFDDLSETERTSVIKSRRGQGKFRKHLIELWRKCSVTKCLSIELLKASHIKPWKDSTNEERLDEYNGLLLIPNLDEVFDAGLVSFDNSGEILISSAIDTDTLDKLGINGREKLTTIHKNNKKYLKYHRNFVFQE